MRAFILALCALLAAGCGATPGVIISGYPIPGPTGPAGADGADGQDGAQGAPGATGPTGATGQDGAGVETVALCPGLAGSHGVFIEYLLRIEGELFGVYAQGQRIFLARLVPGNYVTTDGRDCEFTVTAEYAVEE